MPKDKNFVPGKHGWLDAEELIVACNAYASPPAMLILPAGFRSAQHEYIAR